jgi:superfamily I DNA/RNA helicase
MDTNFKLSDLQQAVLDWAAYGIGSLILVARAGCGKSSTLLALVAFLVARLPRVSIFVGAYNRAIANEFTAKLQEAGIEWRNAQANTIHGAGFAAWKKVAPAACQNVDDKKLSKLLDEEMKTDAQKIRVEPYREMILKAVSLAKQRAFGVLCQIEDRSKWFDIIDHFGLDENLPEDADLEFAVRVCIWLYKRSLMRCREIIDFDDMILAPLYFKARFWQYDWVMIDEAQDTNPARRALALRILKPGGRLVAVGDPAQAIYGFTGADADSLDLIQRAVNARTMPLNVTYRCPKAIVRRAQQWVKDITAHESAPEGTERTIHLTPAPEGQAARPSVVNEQFTADDAILCRNTKPLVELAYSLLRRGVACQVEGREIASGLIALINRWKAVNTPALVTRLTEWREKEVQKWLAKGKENKAEEISDRAETIIVLSQQLQAEGKTTVAELVAFIQSMFGDTPAGQRPKVLTLATAHKSKGREWRRVYLLGAAKYMPSKWARKDWQMEQELNLMYVATTRAMQEIIDVVVEG